MFWAHFMGFSGQFLDCRKESFFFRQPVELSCGLLPQCSVLSRTEGESNGRQTKTGDGDSPPPPLPAVLDLQLGSPSCQPDHLDRTGQTEEPTQVLQVPVFSTLIGRDPTRLDSDWSNASECCLR